MGHVWLVLGIIIDKLVNFVRSCQLVGLQTAVCNCIISSSARHVWLKKLSLALLAIDYYYAALLPRRGPHIASHSVCLSVCPSVPLSWCTFRHALRAAYRTAISAAQILVIISGSSSIPLLRQTYRKHINAIYYIRQFLTVFLSITVVTCFQLQFMDYTRRLVKLPFYFVGYGVGCAPPQTKNEVSLLKLRISVYSE